MAESGGPSVNAMRVPASAVRLTRHPHRFGVEHRLGHLDQNEISDSEGDKRGEELPWQRSESEAGAQR